MINFSISLLFVLALCCETAHGAKLPGATEFSTLGAATVADAPAEFSAFLKKDHERRVRVIKASGVQAE